MCEKNILSHTLHKCDMCMPKCDEKNNWTILAVSLFFAAVANLNNTGWQILKKKSRLTKND